jgi:hypothetical protein
MAAVFMGRDSTPPTGPRQRRRLAPLAAATNGIRHGLGVAPSEVIHLMDRETDDYDTLAPLRKIGYRLFFKALEQGCALEKRQLGNFQGLTNATRLFLPIAWKLLLPKSEELTRPLEPAATILEPDELEVLRLLSRIPLSDTPTTREAVDAITALGGHLKHNGAPGWQTLARG